ncbi:MAG: phosphoribosylformylglycinamidine cyclo-ligase [Gammaproteobacteria bacterium]|uniref:Phosphoribosylformylglycinamidine cyclo-ligase n=1 Tax=SAR86 cluster bacterium TaxID=2030880 RepID=A0A368C4I7_9GAMM|nr:MAG: phosphoribosylformylglycinamidine cyclo-ligase [SAR86 cluster bacterium]|tara:strand:- start:5085 stop:6116 length:1032 start_codon:yes stop_codon:yes gene_type:complete
MTKEIKNNDPYKLAGVDIEAGNSLVDKIKADVGATQGSNVLGNIGGFAGLFKLDGSIKNPTLVACTDGVGTKVALAQENNKLENIGQDLVAMCVNDLVTCGAKPLFFLDYFAASKLDVDHAALIIKSIANACKDSRCALLGGETAEMPGHYVGNNFDLAGFSVGIVNEQKIIDGTAITAGDYLIGIESSGPHSNGYSLIRKIISESNAPIDEINKIIDLVLKPTHLYPNLIENLMNNLEINGMAHITGGGITENIPRIVPDNLCVNINKDSWEMPEVFKWLQSQGNISDSDMLRIFNCGIGMVLIMNDSAKDQVIENIKHQGYAAYHIGVIKEKDSVTPLSYI